MFSINEEINYYDKELGTNVVSLNMIQQTKFNNNG